jgi:hypothetical protein
MYNILLFFNHGFNEYFFDGTALIYDFHCSKTHL